MEGAPISTSSTEDPDDISPASFFCVCGSLLWLCEWTGRGTGDQTACEDIAMESGGCDLRGERTAIPDLAGPARGGVDQGARRQGKRWCGFKPVSFEPGDGPGDPAHPRHRHNFFVQLVAGRQVDRLHRHSGAASSQAGHRGHADLVDQSAWRGALCLDRTGARAAAGGLAGQRHGDLQRGGGSECLRASGEEAQRRFRGRRRCGPQAASAPVQDQRERQKNHAADDEHRLDWKLERLRRRQVRGCGSREELALHV